MEKKSNKTLYFIHEWIGPRGPLVNSRVPHIYDLMKRMPLTDWQRCWMTDDFDPMVMRYRDFVDCKIIPAYDISTIGDSPFVYELTLSMRNGFDLIAIQSGIGILDSVPIDYGVLQAVRKGQGWIVVSNLLESFLEDVSLMKLHNYFTQHQIPLNRIVYLTNCLNSKEVYEDFCERYGFEPEIKCEYAGVYLLDFIANANSKEFMDREYVVGPRKKLFLMFNRRYRPHRMHVLLRLFQNGLLDDSHISFSETHPDDSMPWIQHAEQRCINDNISLTREQLEELSNKLPLVLDTNKFNKFPMEEHPYDTYKFYDESLVHIVSETNFDSNIMHITEKTMKPIMFKQPFVVVGVRHSLKHLREMGFKTFGDIWDESYDDEFDHRARMEKIIELLMEMSRLTDDERVALTAAVKDIVEYNFQHLRNRKATEMHAFCDKYGVIGEGKDQMKKVIVCGAGGFIGTHLVTNLKKQGYYVIGADLKYPEYSTTDAHEFHIMDLRDPHNVAELITEDTYEIYQLAADMGGAGYIFTGENDADIMHNSAMINLNVLHEMVKKGVKRVFYSSSACMYPAHNQTDPDNPLLAEDSAYPADPDSEYGWEKLFSERAYMAFARNYGIRARIARFHNIFGPLGSWNNGKEKAPAALCRKVAYCEPGGKIEVWGPGNQTRSFLYIDECVDGINRIMASDCEEPLNLGSTRMISINNLVKLIAKEVNKEVEIVNVPGPMGVMGRNSDNKLIKEKIGWAPDEDLEAGIRKTYAWIKEQIEKQK